MCPDISYMTQFPIQFHLKVLCYTDNLNKAIGSFLHQGLWKLEIPLIVERNRVSETGSSRQFRWAEEWKGYLSSVWISINQSVMASGIVYIFLGFAVVIGHMRSGVYYFWGIGALGAGRWARGAGRWALGTGNNRLFNFLSDFAEMYDTCKIISQTDHPFNSRHQKSRCFILCLSLDEAH